MSAADGIRRLGFKRWYERQLIESHACFLTCFLCMIVALACLEGLSLGSGGWQPFGMLSVVLAAGAIGVAALRRYQILLGRAEHVAERSTCKHCSQYGRIRILSAGEPGGPTGRSEPWMRVQCRKCGHEWLID